MQARRIALNVTGWLVVVSAFAMIGMAAWATAPYSFSPKAVSRTAVALAKAPFADRIVIGDSRIQFLGDRPEALMMGYSSAQTWQLVRIARLVCALSDAPVTIATGVNDAKRELPATRRHERAIEEMAEACGDRPTTISEVWPAQPEVEPAGTAYDPALIEVIDRQSRIVAARHVNVRLLPVPELPATWTTDGVHFTPEVDELYVRTLTAGAP